MAWWNALKFPSSAGDKTSRDAPGINARKALRAVHAGVGDRMEAARLQLEQAAADEEAKAATEICLGRDRLRKVLESGKTLATGQLTTAQAEADVQLRSPSTPKELKEYLKVSLALSKAKRELPKYRCKAVLMKNLVNDTKYVNAHARLPMSRQLRDVHKSAVKRVKCTYFRDDHTGVDQDCPVGTPVVAVEEGKVHHFVDNWDASDDPNRNLWGNHVVLSHYEGRVFTLYAHLHGVRVDKVGDLVFWGDEVGSAGETGNVGGPHLHFGVFSDISSKKSVDPFKFPWGKNRENEQRRLLKKAY